MKNLKSKINIMLITLFACSAPTTAQSLDNDRFSLSLGVFVTDRDTNVRFDSSLGDGTDTDFESALGLDSSDSVFRFDAYVRFSEKHRVDFSVFDLSRGSTKIIDTDIQWGDTLYSIDTTVKTDFDLAIAKAVYTYSFLSSDDGYLGASIGLHVADLKISLAEENLGQAETDKLTAPLPVIGFRGERRLSDRWSFRASGEFFFLEYDNLDGSLVDVYAGVDYEVTDHMSVGFGYNSVSFNVDASQNNFEGALDWRYSGGLVFLKFDF